MKIAAEVILLLKEKSGGLESGIDSGRLYYGSLQKPLLQRSCPRSLNNTP
jgi:hypothetical protein